MRFITYVAAMLITVTGTDVAGHASADSVRDQSVTYTVTAERESNVHIYASLEDGTSQQQAIQQIARTKVVVSPGKAWSYSFTLKHPEQWAYISATTGGKRDPKLTCTVKVDSKVVVEKRGGSGVLCSLREW